MEKEYVAFPVGLTVTEVRLMTDKELELEGWERSYNEAVVMIFNDGSKVYASCDPEGNDSGSLFGITGQGNSVMVSPVSNDMVPESEIK